MEYCVMRTDTTNGRTDFLRYPARPGENDSPMASNRFRHNDAWLYNSKDDANADAQDIRYAIEMADVSDRYSIGVFPSDEVL